MVLFGSGMQTREVGSDPSILNRLQLDASKQLICAQCSGTYLMAKLDMLGDVPTCTDLMSKPWVIEAGVNVVDQPFT